MVGLCIVSTAVVALLERRDRECSVDVFREDAEGVREGAMEGDILEVCRAKRKVSYLPTLMGEGAYK